MMNAPKVFLSYAREDARLAHQLSERLSAQGLELWRDEDILPGQEWSTAIREAISSSNAFVILYSDSFKDSRALTLELGAILSARGRKGRAAVIPVLVGSTDVKDLPANLQLFQALRFSDESAEEVVDAVVRATQFATEQSPIDELGSAHIPWRPSKADRVEKEARDLKLKRKRIVRLLGIAIAASLMLAAFTVFLSYRAAEQRNTAVRYAELAEVANNETQKLRQELAASATIDLSGAGLSGINLSGVTLRGANLNRAQLVGARIVNSDLRNSTLEFADLHEADLSGTDLRGANLNGANLANANLTDAILEGATMKGANLSEVFGILRSQLDLVCGDSRTILPADLDVRKCEPAEN